MLVLSRKKNQTIKIDGGIEIEVLQTRGGTVKIGISAPEDIRIVRGELESFNDLEFSKKSETFASVERMNNMLIAK